MRRRGRGPVILLAIIVIIVLIGGIVFLGQILFGGHRRKAPALKVDHGKHKTVTVNLLANPTAKTAVQMNARGPIVALERHYDIDMKITNNSRDLLMYKSYNRGNVLKKIHLGNTETAFKDFLLALQQAGYSQKVNPANKDMGICAAGQLITYNIIEDHKPKHTSWTTSCGRYGDFSGNSGAVIDLFLAQFPNARAEIRAIQDNLINGQL